VESFILYQSDERQYCRKNAATLGLPTLLYQPGVRTNLEVTVLYTQVKVMFLLFVTVQLVRDHWGFQAKLLWSQKKFGFLMEEMEVYSKGELLYCNNEKDRNSMLNHTIS